MTLYLPSFAIKGSLSLFFLDPASYIIKPQAGSSVSSKAAEVSISQGLFNNFIPIELERRISVEKEEEYK